MKKKTKYNRLAKKADDVKTYLNDFPSASARDVTVMFGISMSYAHKLVSRYKGPEIAAEPSERSDGSTASYYVLPTQASQLQHLISHKNMNAQIGEIFRAAYRYGESSHSNELRDAKKIMFYIQAEVSRLEGC